MFSTSLRLSWLKIKINTSIRKCMHTFNISLFCLKNWELLELTSFCANAIEPKMWFLLCFFEPHLLFFIVILWLSQNPNVGAGTCPILGRHKQSIVWLTVQKSWSCCLFCTHNLKLPYLWQLAKKDKFPNHEPTEKRQNKKNSALATHCSLAFLFGFHFLFLHLLWIVIVDHKCCLLSLGVLHKSRVSMATKLTRLPQNCPTIHLWSGVFHNFNCNKNIGHALTLTWNYGFRIIT